MATKQKERGNHGEEIVASELEKQGLIIVARNYRKQFGEIDLIATHKNLLVFVEVKLRLSNGIDLAELIIPAKQRRIIATARAYLAEHEHENKMCRFDVALVDLSNHKPRITYIPDAFQEYD